MSKIYKLHYIAFIFIIFSSLFFLSINKTYGIEKLDCSKINNYSSLNKDQLLNCIDQIKHKSQKLKTKSVYISENLRKILNDLGYRTYQDYQKNNSTFLQKHIQLVAEWQLRASEILLYVVIIIITTGLVLSVAHFIYSIKLHRLSDNTELNIEKDKMAIKSNVIGIIILIISMIFCYIFITEVYNIKITQIS